jgi:hypothetical protein
MKILLMIITILCLLFLYTKKDTPNDDPIPYGSNSQLEAIRKDIEAQIASLSLEQKLELCLLDFSFASPEYYQYLLDNKPDNVKTTLLESEVFVKICKNRKIDPNDIPTDYFSPYK